MHKIYRQKLYLNGCFAERMPTMNKTTDLFDLEHTLAGSYLAGYQFPWQALGGIGEMIRQLGKQLGSEYTERHPSVWVHRSAEIAPTAYLGAPCIIDAGTQIRHGAFIRGNALIGKNCVVGNSVELKNVILFDNVQVPHFNYVGDSILGYKAHLGAGAVTSNVKSDKTPVVIKTPEDHMETGLKKCGAMVGDRVEVGCNSVLNPGSVIGRDSIIYPTSCVRGFVPACSIWKDNGNIVKREMQ